MTNSLQIVENARKTGLLVPAFNIPYLPMMESVVRAVVDEDSVALIEVARLEWRKFKSGSMKAVFDEFMSVRNDDHVRLHLDHIPVIDEDQQQVDYLAIIAEAIQIGYQSVMLDGSRLSLEDNIAATRKVSELAHKAGLPCEAELGAVLGHEAGPLPPYEELFESGKGFTDPKEAERFVRETGCDWLSVAIGNIHGQISEARRDEKKVEARLNIEHLQLLSEASGVPLVLHGGSGVQQRYVLEAVKKGIAKMNIGTEIRQVYETSLRADNKPEIAREAVYQRTRSIIKDYLGLSGTRAKLL